MLTEERFAKIVKIVNQEGTVTVLELAQAIGISESTIRRDLNQLDKLGRIRKVHGGATAVVLMSDGRERNMQEKYSRNIEEKRAIAAYAATLVHANDFVFLDAGSTTEQMAEYLEENTALYVTNGITLAQKLAARGFKTMLLAGRVKTSTDAVIGMEAVASLSQYHFTRGFFGTNGITVAEGFTTPDLEEAANKRAAMEHCRQCYVLADNSKFDTLSNDSIGEMSKAKIITTRGNVRLKNYKQHTEVIEV